MTARRRTETSAFGSALLGCFGLVAAACSGSGLIEPVDPSVELLERETATISVRYTDNDGVPIAAASIRFEIVPGEEPANGALLLLLLRRAAVTGEDGIASVQLRAHEEAAFSIAAYAPHAAEPARIDVNVSRNPGLQIDVSVYQASAVEVLEAEVLLVDDLDCANFDELELPPPSDDGIDTAQTVVVQPGKASTVVFSGLRPEKRYTVAAVGRAGDQIVAHGCRNGLFITREMIDDRRPKSVSLDLEERGWAGWPSELSVITKFNDPIQLAGVVALLKSIAEHENGPAGQVLSRMSSLAEGNDNDMARILTAYREPLAQLMSLDDSADQEIPSTAQARLTSAAAALASVGEVQLHSRISVPYEYGESVVPSERSLRHRIHKLTALILETNGQQVRRDFSLMPLANPRISELRRVFAGTAPKLEIEDTATLRVDDTARVSISPHQMDVPLVDAILGEILYDYFGAHRFDHILRQLIDCAEAGASVDGYVEEMQLDEWTLGSSFMDQLTSAGVDVNEGMTLGTVVAQMCQREVERIVAEVQEQAQEDLGAFGTDQPIVFEGSAQMLMIGDGTAMGWLKKGHWTDVGTFEAKRD